MSGNDPTPSSNAACLEAAARRDEARLRELLDEVREVEAWLALDLPAPLLDHLDGTRAQLAGEVTALLSRWHAVGAELSLWRSDEVVEEDGPAADEPTGDEPAADEPTEDEPPVERPTEDEPTEEEPGGAEPTGTGHVDADPAEPELEPAEPEPAEPEPAEPEPAEPEPAEPEPAEPEPAEPEPAELEPEPAEAQPLPATPSIPPTARSMARLAQQLASGGAAAQQLAAPPPWRPALTALLRGVELNDGEVEETAAACAAVDQREAWQGFPDDVRRLLVALCTAGCGTSRTTAASTTGASTPRSVG